MCALCPCMPLPLIQQGNIKLSVLFKALLVWGLFILSRSWIFPKVFVIARAGKVRDFSYGTFLTPTTVPNLKCHH